MRHLSLLAALLCAVCFGQEQQTQPSQPIPDDLNLLVGKKVVVGRLPLCVPKTFTSNLAYSGKTATVASVKPNTTRKFPPNVLSRMTPEMREMMQDTQKGATILLKFEDGTELDTCAPIGPKRLAENLELAAGETIALPATSQVVGGAPSAGSPVNASTPASVPVPTTPQECPVVVTKLTSGD